MTVDHPADVPNVNEPPRTGLSRGALLGIIGGSVAFFLVGAILVVVIVLRVIGGGSMAGGEGEAKGSTPPAGVVTGYLEALAASDAATALSFVDNAPPDSPFLTDEALQASNALAPITDIVVVEPADADFFGQVTASYSIGDVPVTTDFSVNEYRAEGRWQMATATVELDFGIRFDGLDLTLNGEPLESGPVEVFPGTYELATTTPNFVIEGETVVTVREPYDYPTLSDTTAALSGEGVTVFRMAVHEAVAPCLASKTYAAGCGLDLPELLDDGTRLVDGTLTRSLNAEGQATLETLEPQVLSSDPLIVRSEFIGGVGVTADVEQDGVSGTGEVLFAPSLGAPVVDFTSGTPVVRWD